MPVSDEFLTKGRAMAQRLGLSFAQLLFVMNSESGLNPAALNPSGGASGLIQFMPMTLAAYGLTPEELRAMTREEQLPYVERFLRPYAGKKLSSVGRIHQALMAPASLDVATRPDDVIAARGGKRYGGQEAAVYAGNARAFDPKGLGVITARMMEDRDIAVAKTSPLLLSALARLKELHPEDFRNVALVVAAQVAAGTVLAGAAYWWFFRRKRRAA